MTGRELIVYILQNHLEDEPVVKDGTFVGYVTVSKAAAMLHVGEATIYTLIELKLLQSVRIGDALYIPIERLVNQDENGKEQNHER